MRPERYAYWMTGYHRPHFARRGTTGDEIEHQATCEKPCWPVVRVLWPPAGRLGRGVREDVLLLGALPVRPARSLAFPSPKGSAPEPNLWGFAGGSRAGSAYNTSNDRGTEAVRIVGGNRESPAKGPAYQAHGTVDRRAGAGKRRVRGLALGKTWGAQANAATPVSQRSRVRIGFLDWIVDDSGPPAARELVEGPPPAGAWIWSGGNWRQTNALAAPPAGGRPISALKNDPVLKIARERYRARVPSSLGAQIRSGLFPQV